MSGNISGDDINEMENSLIDLRKDIQVSKKHGKFIPEDNEELEENDIYDENENNDSSSEKVEILFMPFVDSNALALLYDNKDWYTKNQPYEFPLIKRSTFVNEEDDILCIVKDKFVMFSRTGEFLGFIKFFTSGIQ